MARKRVKKTMNKSTNGKNVSQMGKPVCSKGNVIQKEFNVISTPCSSNTFNHAVSNTQSNELLFPEPNGIGFSAQPDKIDFASNTPKEMLRSEEVLFSTELKGLEKVPALPSNLGSSLTSSDSKGIIYHGDRTANSDYACDEPYSDNLLIRDDTPEHVNKDPSILTLSYCSVKEVISNDLAEKAHKSLLEQPSFDDDRISRNEVNTECKPVKTLHDSPNKIATRSTGLQSMDTLPILDDSLNSCQEARHSFSLLNRFFKKSAGLLKGILNIGQFFCTLVAVFAFLYYQKLRATVFKYFWGRKKKVDVFCRYPKFPSTTPELQSFTANAVAGWSFIYAPTGNIESAKENNFCCLFPGLQRWTYVGQSNSDSTLPYTSFNSCVTPNAQDLPVRQQIIKDKILPLYDTSPSTVKESCKRGSAFLRLLQCKDGHWAGDYGGPHFLLPGLIIVAHAIGLKFEEHQQRGFLAYLKNHQQVDGGWGIHIEGPSQMYCTSLCYVALRLLDCSPLDPALTKALNFIHLHGGITRAPLWSKVFLAIIGLYSWEGVPPLPIELVILPLWCPFSAGNLWCHARVVFVPMAYLYSIRWVAKASPIVETIRNELYTQDFCLMDWCKARRLPAADIDVYNTVPLFVRYLFEAYGWYEKYVSQWKPFSYAKKHAQRFALKNIEFEDEITHYLNLGPVNKVLNMLVRHIQDPDSVAVAKHIERVKDYLWVAEDGLKMQGEPGAQTWETSFGALALIATGEHEANTQSLECALMYLKKSQMTEPIINKRFCWRNRVKGGWGFTVKEQNWPVSDTTAEALLAVLQIQDLKTIPKLVSYTKLCDSINLLLQMQNPCGGWSTYEPYRASPWLEIFNVLEVFGNVMIDYPWLECTASCVVALLEFNKRFPNYKPQEIRQSIVKGRSFIISQQTEDGGWYGGWGVCFTYGAMFAAKALKGASAHNVAARSALKLSCDFLISHQHSDGGWAESFQSCLDHKYVDSKDKTSQVVQSAWALLALIYSNCASKDSIDRAAQFLIKQQDLHGMWHQKQIVGQFNCSTGITYANFPIIFPLWALAEYSKIC